ncbi:MAG: Aspartate carbamoyltransferase [Candidatus Curtissbacteria bacterium GW2011_GWA1_40_16]|uniref:Aspartate carbamoyltransferase n=1 Tax=Candidatus Curtissbacteria bacterium GW2011_GWA1_40_16 TaxID=1618405 RepID=A0A0G0UMG4_9BACT|nr:MAG: Aspartate carbamoyltransferase [Candidatus Curtissbacteria bacterium GW2011_GWA1_40_16]
MIKNIISAKQFDKLSIEEIFRIVNLVKSGKYDNNAMSGKIMSTLFYEPSTRTRLSFESSMLRLGGGVISTESAAEFSSASKGETLEDTIRVVNAFSDVIVLRHFAAGASIIAQKYSRVPIINAGDGNGEHPSQALLDLYTIFSKFSGKDMTVAMVGDLLNGRTIHSLSVLLSLYPQIKLIYVSPQALAIPKSLKTFLKGKKIKYSETLNLDTALKNADVIYQTRIQKERFKNETDYIKFKGLYILDKNSLKRLKKKAIIMHPLPRVNEITPDVDDDPRAVYFEQVQNGLYVRMALLLYLFDKPSAKTR